MTRISGGDNYRLTEAEFEEIELAREGYGVRGIRSACCGTPCADIGDNEPKLCAECTLPCMTYKYKEVKRKFKLLKGGLPIPTNMLTRRDGANVKKAKRRRKKKNTNF